MFKLLPLLLVAMSVAAVIPDSSETDYHDTLDDYFDFEAASPEEFKDIMRCVSDQGPCSDLAASYRKHYPHAMHEACGRCSVHQKHMVRVLLERFKKELPELFQTYKTLHDPQGIYYDKFEAAVAGY